MPVITTARFELWQPQASDLDQLFALTEDDETRRFLGPSPASMKDSFDRLHRHAGSWALHGYGSFSVRQTGQSAIVASCGIFQSWRDKPGLNDVPEAGWITHRDWRGQGVAGEAMAAVLDWFDRVHGPQRIGCMIEHGNAPSERLAAALGFVEYARQDDDEGQVVVIYARG